MGIDHDSLAKELEVKFADRFTEKDEDYVKSLKLKNIPPPCIYPWFNHQNRRRGDYNNQYNQQSYHQQRHHPNPQYESNEGYHQYEQDRSAVKRHRYD